MKKGKQPEVFISYSHKEKADIAGEIEKSLSNRGLDVIRDKTGIDYKDSIRCFTQRLGAGKYIIVLISKFFLESKYCMEELLSIYENKRFKERIFPLLMPGTNIFDAEDRLPYYRYWEAKIEKLEKEITKGKDEDNHSIKEELLLFKDIRKYFDKMIDVIQDMRTGTVDEHRENDFLHIYEKITQQVETNQSNKQVKILSITASPREANPLLYEQEQDTLLDMFKDLKSKRVYLDIPDPVHSTLEEIETYLADGHHDILHITAHGGINKEGDGVLAFEDERGNLVDVTGVDLAILLKKLQKDHQFKLSIVILSSCHSARRELHLLPVAESLHAAGIPAVIGMQESISHLAAIDFNTGFFQGLLAGQAVQEAFEAGRMAIAEAEAKRLRDDPSWNKTGEDEIPHLLLNKKKLSMKNFNDDTIDAPGAPASHQFIGANYLERGFIGRRDILRQVYQRVEEGAGAIILKGPGGIGKSTITTRVAARLRRKDYHFIIIPGATSPEGILEKINQSFCAAGANQKFLGIQNPSFKKGFGRRRQEKIAEAEEVYGSDLEAEQKLSWYIEYYLLKEPVVIIFDNFEENQDAGQKGKLESERLAGFLKYFNTSLQGKGKSSLLFFSTRYTIPGFEAATLDIPEFSLVECRKMMWNHDTLKRLEESSKAALVREIGGNPRALELLDRIAGEEYGTGAFTWEELVELIPEMRERIIHKEGAGDDFTPLFLGQLLTYLGEQELQLLTSSSYYRNPVVKAAIEAQGISVERGQRRRLEELSLLEYRKETRLHYVHRLTAHYVLSRLPKQEIEAGHRKAAEYFDGLRYDEDKRLLDDAMEARWHYLRAGEWDRAAELTFALEDYLTLHGSPQLSMELLQEIEKTPVSEKNRAILYHQKGILLQTFSGDYDKALEQYQQSLEIEQRLGNIKGVATSLHQVGMIYQEKGEYDRALEQYQKSLEIKEKIGDIKGVATSYGQIGIIYQYKGDFDQALKQYEKAKNSFEKIGNIKGVATSLHQVGNIYYLKGDYDRALEQYQKSLEIAEKIGDIKGVAESLHNIGAIYQDKGDYDRALEQYQQAQETFEKIGDIKSASAALHQVGNIYYQKGEYERALEQYQKSLEIKQKIGDIKGVATSLHNIGAIYQEKGDYDRALEQYQQALEIAEKIGDIKGVAQSLHQVGIIYQDKGDYDRALEQYQKAQDTFEKIGDIANYAMSLGQMGNLQAQLENYPQALRYFLQAFLIFAKIGSPYAKAMVNNISIIKEKVPPQEFSAILEEFGLPAGDEEN